MPGSMLQMASLGEPIAKGKPGTLPSGPWVASNAPQMHLPHCLSLQYTGGKGPQKSGPVTTRCAALAEGSSRWPS